MATVFVKGQPNNPSFMTTLMLLIPRYGNVDSFTYDNYSNTHAIHYISSQDAMRFYNDLANDNFIEVIRYQPDTKRRHNNNNDDFNTKKQRYY